MTLDAPAKFKEDVNVWADEAIWGHRFHDDQTPWLILLEFMAVFRSRRQSGTALCETRQDNQHENIRYHIPRHTTLRRLIFNNPHMNLVEQGPGSDSEKWNRWFASMEDGDHYRYLQRRFQNFSELVRLVDFFRATSIEAHRQRRWTSRFVFPYGPSCLYADLRSIQDASQDRRFFGRTGELLYLMLSRYSRGKELAEKISDRLFREDDQWDRVVRALLPPGESLDHGSIEIERIGYLPFAQRGEYEALGNDWWTLLESGLPGSALLDPLMRISALHMLIYMLRRGEEEAERKDSLRFVLEVAGPVKTQIRDLSQRDLKTNRKISEAAIRRYIMRSKEDQGWGQAQQARNRQQATQAYLAERFSWKPQDGVPMAPERILAALEDYSLKRHKSHVAKVHLECAKQIGLAVSRRGVGSWYSPNDGLLKALVMTTIDSEREEYGIFLSRLYEKYRLVIGMAEAMDAFGKRPADEKSFMQNTQRLEQRLRTLGLLHRLSDDCAYVKNPFWRAS